MKMFSEIFLLVIIVVILIYLSFHFAVILFAPVTKQNPQNQVCFGPFDTAQGRQNCFFVELAKTEVEREKGLMNRKELDKNKGMLFIFDKEGVYSFWMKNTLIPLDMVWINQNYKVVSIIRGVQPCKTFICPTDNPSASAKYVLEVNAGIVKEIGLQIGDNAIIKIQ